MRHRQGPLSAPCYWTPLPTRYSTRAESKALPSIAAGRVTRAADDRPHGVVSCTTGPCASGWPEQAQAAWRSACCRGVNQGVRDALQVGTRSSHRTRHTSTPAHQQPGRHHGPGTAHARRSLPRSRHRLSNAGMERHGTPRPDSSAEDARRAKFARKFAGAGCDVLDKVKPGLWPGRRGAPRTPVAALRSRSATHTTTRCRRSTPPAAAALRGSSCSAPPPTSPSPASGTRLRLAPAAPPGCPAAAAPAAPQGAPRPTGSYRPDSRGPGPAPGGRSARPARPHGRRAGHAGRDHHHAVGAPCRRREPGADVGIERHPDRIRGGGRKPAPDPARSEQRATEECNDQQCDGARRQPSATAARHRIPHRSPWCRPPTSHATGSRPCRRRRAWRPADRVARRWGGVRYEPPTTAAARSAAGNA